MKNDKHETAVFDSLCAITILVHHHGRRSIISWTSHLHPALRLICKDYERFSFISAPKSIFSHAVANTSSQSHLASTKIINRLILKDDLIPITIKMHTAVDKSITILGANQYYGFVAKTNWEKLIRSYDWQVLQSLSCKEACIAFCTITTKFSTIGEATFKVRAGPGCQVQQVYSATPTIHN